RQEGEAEKARGTQLEREAAALERERDLARRKAREAESTLAKLRDAGVNVARLSGERPMPNVRATVVQVDNRAVPPTLLIDAGQVQGLEPGDELDLIRDGRRVGRIEVDELQPRLARCRLVSGQRGLSVQVGDEVKTSIRE
ncbi:MAG TPA: hypothetical protein DEA08_23625, partial [Planctomycetes bacterium]|nr:hypothetical protein [Planctomycetota bacterium]